MKVMSISAYRFVPLDAGALPSMRDTLRTQARERNIKGSILLGEEGINLSLAGAHEDVESLKTYLATFPQFNNMDYKASWSASQPFKRMLVKIKPEIIAFDMPNISPAEQPAPYVEPLELKRWYEEGRDMLILDTRNDYEVMLGTFNNAVDLGIHRFKDFPSALEAIKQEPRDRIIVTFCTGGVRCEKAAPYLQQLGFKNVYQLHGGIFKYFEQCGKDHYSGECFVFDKRIAIDDGLQETSTIQCVDCRSPLTVEEQKQTSAKKACPYCGSGVAFN